MSDESRSSGGADLSFTKFVNDKSDDLILRNQEMVELKKTSTYQEIADKFGISPERVREIVLRENRKKAKADRDAKFAEENPNLLESLRLGDRLYRLLRYSGAIETLDELARDLRRGMITGIDGIGAKSEKLLRDLMRARGYDV